VARLHEEPGVLHAVIDEALALGELGLVVSGWFHAPAVAPRAVTVVTAEGVEHDVTAGWARVYREDVLARVGRPRDRQENLGFLCALPLPTVRGELRLLRFDLGPAGDRWLRLPTERIVVPGAALAQEILGRMRAPERLRGQLFGILDGGFGRFIERVVAAEPRAGVAVQERQFGTAPVEPRVSVIVPLYGRFDFVRHQLAQFAADAEFDHVDLIYVIDDPSIAAATLEHGAHYHPVFGRAFRMLACARNLGFAGANNVGVRHARADTVVLLNSDVIPQQPGWTGALLRALGELPQAGVVGPLLEFHDGGVQHAGMVPRHDPALPGFVMNAHPGKGQPWRGGSEPVAQRLMTGACLCLRKADYLAAGGLDEGYLVGDFEDSDLCMGLRARGLRAWLLPHTRLWHLERQSQNAGAISAERQLLTLYNAWRYRRRILDGVIADPEAVEA
jgi:GT2 family glycosyltransferase